MRSGPTIALAAALLATSTLRAQVVTGPLEDVDGRIVFQIAEQIDSAGRPSPLRIDFWSEKEFGGPTGLLVSVTRRENTFTFSDWQLAFPSGVVPGLVAQAHGSVVLPVSVGAYELVIRRSGIDDHYRVILEPELIHVAPIGVPRVSVTGDTLIRRAIPGSLAVNCRDASWVCARVFRELALVPGLRPFAFPATGRNPFGELITRPYGGGHEPPRYFRYGETTQVHAARSVVQRANDEWHGPWPRESTVLVLWRDQTIWWERPLDPSHPPSQGGR